MTAPTTADAGPSGARTDAVAPKRGDTHVAVEGESAPRLPNERDESSDSGGADVSAPMRQAKADVDSGKAPTDRSEATDEVYARTLRSRTPGAERDKGGPSGGTTPA